MILMYLCDIDVSVYGKWDTETVEAEKGQERTFSSFCVWQFQWKKERCSKRKFMKLSKGLVVNSQ